MTHTRNRLLFAGVPVAAPAGVDAPEAFARTRLRARMEAAVERLLAALDAMDGDPDLEAACEDEGAQCDDEGAIEYDLVPDDGLDGLLLTQGVR